MRQNPTSHCSMMEQPDMRHRHRNPILIARFNHVIVSNGSAALCDVGDTAAVRALDVVAEREERVRAEGDAADRP